MMRDQCELSIVDIINPGFAFVKGFTLGHSILNG